MVRYTYNNPCLVIASRICYCSSVLVIYSFVTKIIILFYYVCELRSVDVFFFYLEVSGCCLLQVICMICLVLDFVSLV